MLDDLGILMIRYFPAFALVANFLNFLYLRLVRKKMNSATKKFLIYSTVYFIMWGMLQLIGGYKTFMFILLPPREHPLVMVFWLFHLVSVWGFSVWMTWGNESEQVLENEMIDGDVGEKKKRAEMLGLAIMGSTIPVVVFLGHLTGFFDQIGIEIGLETMFEGFNIPWP